VEAGSGARLSQPERPDRLRAAAGVLAALGLMQECERLLVREATKAEIALVTSAQHRAFVSSALARAELCSPGEAFFAPGDLYWCSETGLAARLALGAVIEAVQCAARGLVARALCLVRPPGHHAHKSASQGFCVYNNVGGAIAAALAADPALSRVLVVDLDVHHGDGTQLLFAEDPRVLTFSLHRYDGGAFYPCSGHAESVGTGAGAGFSCNVGLDGSWHGDSELCAVVDSLLAPLSRAFAPQLILVSLGLDSGRGDPLGDMDFTGSGYAYAMHALCALGAPLVVALEGGYNLAQIGSSLAAVTRVLLGEAPVPLSAGELQIPRLPEAAVLEGGDGGDFFGALSEDPALAQLSAEDRAHTEELLLRSRTWRAAVQGGEGEGGEPHPGRKLGVRPAAWRAIAATQAALRPFWPGTFPPLPPPALQGGQEGSGVGAHAQALKQD